MPDNTPIRLFPNGKVTKGDLTLYTPGSPTYEAFHQDEHTPNVLLFSRRGTGKSWTARWQLHRLALKHPGFKYLVVRNSKPELQRTHLQFLEKEMDQLGGSYARVMGQADYPNGSVGLWCGFEKEADALKLLGASLDALLVEEITTVRWGLVVDLAASLRTTKDSGRVAQLLAATNPYGPYSLPVKRHWIDQDLTQDEEPGYDPSDWLAIRTEAEDNPYLDFKSYDKRLGSLQREKRRAWLLGEWSTAEGSFFSEFEPERNGEPFHVINRLPALEGGKSVLLDCPIYRAVDWGFADDPAVCLWIAVLPNNRAIVIKEMSWKRTPAVEVAHEIIGHSRGMKIVQTFCDPTMFNGQRHGAQSVGDLFELEGVPLTQSVNDRSVPTLHEYLSSTLKDGLPKIQFWAEGCPTLIRTLPEQTANTLHPERMADSKTDHHSLCLSYFTAGGVTGQVGLPKQSATPKWMQPRKGERAILGTESVK